MSQQIPVVPTENPDQSNINLPRVTNPYLGIWWTAQTVTNVPEQVMGWLVAQGFEVTGITPDNTTVPPTNYYSLSRQGMQPQQVLLSLCNSYTLAANEARDANQLRYNEIVTDWTEMIDSSQTHFNEQVDEQNAVAGIYLTDLDTYMTAVETLINDNRSQMVTDAQVAKDALDTMDGRLVDLETNATNTATQIETLLTTQDTNLQTFLNDYVARLAELDANYSAHLATVLAEISGLETIQAAHIAEYNSQFVTLLANYTTHEATIDALLASTATDLSTFVSDIETILSQLDADYASVDTDLNAIITSSEALIDSHAPDYKSVLALLESDYNTHAPITRGFLTDLGATDLARINEEFAAKLAQQLQTLTNQGLFNSVIQVDITERNTRDRDEQIQILNDRLNREKWENQHRLYEQQVAMRARTLDAKDRIHSVEQEVLRYQATLISSIYSLLQEARNRVLAGKQAIFAARDANNRLQIQVESDLYAKLQDVRLRTIESKDRIYQLQDTIAKWENTQTNQLYEQLQQTEREYLTGIDRQYAAKQDVTRSTIGQRDTLLGQLQQSVTGLISGKERYAAIYTQTASTLADHKHRAISEQMNSSVARLEGWNRIAQENRQLMAYQLDERNKLLIGIYSFVERREDIAPEWKDMASMIAGLGDSAGGWIQP